MTVLCGRMQAHQMEQVKSENGRLEAAISKERFSHAKVEQECEKLQAQVTQLEAREKEVDAAIRDASAEVTQLTAVVAEAEKVGGGDPFNHHSSKVLWTLRQRMTCGWDTLLHDMQSRDAQVRSDLGCGGYISWGVISCSIQNATVGAFAFSSCCAAWDLHLTFRRAPSPAV